MKEKQRCDWCLKDDLYKQYHDHEWGIPSHDDQHLFEMLILETFQAGLSWYTILAKREYFRRAFDNFNAELMAGYGERDIERLMGDAGIIRNRQKIQAAVSNAKMFLKVRDEFGTFDKYIWQFTGYKTIVNKLNSIKEYQPVSKESDAMSKDMKKRGFKFVGSTTTYAYMQSVGMVDDHLSYCWKRKK